MKLILWLWLSRMVLYSDEEYGIELSYPEYLEIGDNPQTFGLNLKGTVFTIPSIQWVPKRA